MTKPSDETEMFRMNLAWEDEDEVVVKLEPVDSPIVPRVGNERDLIPNEEWTRDEDIHRRSYTNKRLKISTEVKEITFRIEDSPEKEKQRSVARVPPVSFAAKSSIVGGTEDYLDVSESLALSDVKKTTRVSAPSNIVKPSLRNPVNVTAKKRQAIAKATQIVGPPANIKQSVVNHDKVVTRSRSGKQPVVSPGKTIVPPTNVNKPEVSSVKVLARNRSAKRLVESPANIVVPGTNVNKPVASSVKVLAPHRTAKQQVVSSIKTVEPPSSDKQPEASSVKVAVPPTNVKKPVASPGKVVVSPTNVNKPVASSVKVLPPYRTAKQLVPSAIKTVVPPTNVKQPEASSVKVVVPPKNIPTPVVSSVKVVAPNVNTKQPEAVVPTNRTMTVLPERGTVTSPPPLPTAVQKLSAPIPTKEKHVNTPVTCTATTPKTSIPVDPKMAEKPRVVAMLRNKSPGEYLFLTPVSKAEVMRSKSAVRLLPEEAVLKKSATPAAPKLPIYLRKIPEPAKPDKTKPAAAEISYTGIFSSTSEPMTWRNKQGVEETNELRSNWLQTAQNFWKVPKHKAPRKEPRKQQEVGQEIEHKCTICSKSFAKKKHLTAHYKIHTGEKRAANKPCPECNKLFADNTQLRIHMRVHTGDTPFSCSLCNKRFKHLTSLSRHHLFHTKERPFPCGTCPKTYRIKSDLVNHMRVHTDERPYACKYCGKRFKDRCANNTHERIHRDKKYKCGICLREFTQSTTLRGHMVTHTDERPFSCVLCDMKFKSKTVLRSHERVHTAGKTFKCEFCDLLFTEKRTLLRHSYTHEEKEKPFPCSFCKRWYFRQDRYLAHIETHNMKERPFKCTKCHKCYTSKGYLKLHKEKAHLLGPKEYVCKFKGCGQKFPRLIQLTRHLVVHGELHSLECDICKKRFGKKKTLQMHLIKVHNFASYFTCSKCHKTFIRKAVLNRHILKKCS